MPFLIRYPRLIEPGSVNDNLCINVDIAPTLLELAGVAIPSAMQGRSMKALLRGETPTDWRASQFYTYWSAPRHYGIRTERYTYLKVRSHAPELFDRQADPRQLHNIAGNPENKTLVARLEEALQRQIQAVGISRAELPGADRE